jgi:5-methylthioadenosine/S-adenosylhomocysteine deaminase
MIGDAIMDFKLVETGGIEQIGKYTVQMEKAYKTNPLINFTISPHAIYTCSTRTLEKCVSMALDNDLLVQTHLSETEREVKDSLTAFGKLPIRYLKDIGMLKTKLVIAHGIWVTEKEMEILAEYDTSVAICTESNLKLAAGIAPLKNYFKHKVRCCFATDGVASNNNLDLLAEMDFTAKLHKMINHDPTFLPAEQVLAMATVEAARALHRYDELGSLETGKKADLVVLDCNSVEGQPMHNPYSQVVYALGGRAVRDVIINGEIVLRNKKLTKVDELEIIATAKEYAKLIQRELYL